MSNQGPDRRRRRGQAPDGSSRHGQHAGKARSPWETDGQPNAAARPGATFYQHPAAHHDYTRFQGGTAYQDPSAYQDPQAYQDPTAHQDPSAYQSPRAYQDPSAYQDPGTYQDPQAYQDPSAYQDPGAYQGHQAYQDQRAYQGHQAYRDPGAYEGSSGYRSDTYQGTSYPGGGAPGGTPSHSDGADRQRTGYRAAAPLPDVEDPGPGYQHAGYQEPPSPGYPGATADQEPDAFAAAGRSPSGYADPGGYSGTGGYPGSAAYSDSARYQEPADFGRATFQDQAPAREAVNPPAGEHPSLPGVKLADLAAQDPTAYQGLERYLNGTGAGADGGVGAGPPWLRRGRGLLAGIVTGLLSGAVAIGVAILAAAFVRPQASPVIAIGDAVLGQASSGVRTFAIQSFGESYKLMLLAGIYAVVAVLAMTIGLLARRRLAGGVTGMAALGAFGAFVALTRPESHATDVIPSLIGGVAGVGALVLLVRAGDPQLILPATAQRARGGYRRGEPEVVGTNRRSFLLAGLTAAGAAVVAGVAGKVLGKQQASADGYGSGVTPLEEAPPLQPGAELTMPGLSPFYTPNATFYRVDTALVVPQLTTANWELRIHGMVDKPVNINFDELMKRPQIQRDITIVCVSESVGGGYIGNARWQGARLADLLREAGVHPGATQIVMRDTQGMAIGVSTQAVLDGRDAMLAVAMNGVPLPPEHGFPVRVVVPGLYGYASACKWVVDMELTTYAAYDAYWVKRGWAEQAEIKTESRIDTPKPGKALPAGPVVVAGVAWAQRKGVARVEVGVHGVWHEATLATQDTIDTWRQWYYRWDATPGAHKIQVRATDQTGYTQTAVVQGAEPNGATGYHTIQVSVA